MEEFTPQQHKKFNGQSVMLALESMGGSATVDDLTKHIGVLIEQSDDLVKPEVKKVLRRGITNGFLQRRGKNYFLFNQSNAYEVDSKPKRKRKADSSPSLTLTKDNNKIIRSLPLNLLDNVDNMEKEIDEQSIEGLQEIILKANEETQKATVLATRAAKLSKLASTKIQKIIDDEDSNADD